MRELRVEDALLYLDQVKVEFGDRPHIYNEFLDIMKTFKTQQIDTPGVIRRVSTLFQGNRKLVLGFNTFLPEGYKIEIPEDGHGPPVAVYRAPGSNATHILRESAESQAVVLGGHSSGASAPNRGMVQAGPPAVMRMSHPPAAGMPSTIAQDGYRMAPRGDPTSAYPPSKEPPSNNSGMGMSQESASIAAARGSMVNNNALPPDSTSLGPPTASRGIRAGVPPNRRFLPPQIPGGLALRTQDPNVPSSQPKSAGPVQVQQQQLQQQMQQQRPMRPPMEDKMNGMGRGQRPLPTTSILPTKRPGDMLPKGPFDPLSPPQQRPQLQPQPQQQHAIPQPPPPQPHPPIQQPQQPLEFDHAINYVTTIKRRFASEPETYKKFLDILHTYQKEQRGINEVLDDVSNLFEDHPDLLKEFTYFLPDAVQSQAKAQLEIVAKEAEARKLKKAKDAIMVTAQTMQQQAKAIHEQNRRSDHAQFTTGESRAMDRETSIIRRAQFGKVSFDPMRPPRKNSLTPAQAALKVGRPTSIPELPKSPNTTEAAFFKKAKEHLNRKELAADKPPGSRRHTPWLEFLKCLHLFGAGILNRDELLLLLKGLLVHGHAPKGSSGTSSGNVNPTIVEDAYELMREFETVMVGRGPYARQEAALKSKSKYGTLRARDFDFGNCEHPTPSYWSYPGDYPKALFLDHPGQTEEDDNVLNDKLLCVVPLVNTDGEPVNFFGIEDSQVVRKRHNLYEDLMFRIEDERYELDMAIERNMHALKSIEPFAVEALSLREQEEKDGQPIGRLRYKLLDRYALNSIPINAIGRIYGDRGDEVLQHILRNPLVGLPIVYQRLKQKDIEWRKAKAELSETWNFLQESNYEGSMDVQCYFNRRELEASFASSILKDHCKRVRSYLKNPQKLPNHKAIRPFNPSFGNRIPDFGAVLHQPFVVTECQTGSWHKYAFEIVAHKVNNYPNLSSLNRERVGRIWAEFIVPWFDYPTYWVTREVRESFGGKLTSTMVKYVAGQRVKTIMGEGNILAYLPASTNAEPRYRVRIGYGVAFLAPSAIFHAIPNKDSPHVRRDGVMVRDESALNDEDSLDADKLDKKYKLLFGTECIYLFLRLYNLLCLILADSTCVSEETGAPVDPAVYYHNPQRQGLGHLFYQNLNIAGVCDTMKRLTKNEISFRDFVSFGRKISREKVHQFAAIPKLVEKCADYLVRVAKEDALLQLYDYCYHTEVDPVAVRAQCLAVVPEAIYRIQYDTESNNIMYCYLPESEPLLANPRGELDDAEDEGHVDAHEDPMDEDDPLEEFEDDPVPTPPVAKRAKLK